MGKVKGSHSENKLQLPGKLLLVVNKFTRAGMRATGYKFAVLLASLGLTSYKFAVLLASLGPTGYKFTILLASLNATG